VTEGGEGERPAHHNRGEAREGGFQGKPREEWHPMDKHSGTVGKKVQRKGGNRQGGTGEDKKDDATTPVVKEEGAEGEEAEKKEEGDEEAKAEDKEESRADRIKREEEEEAAKEDEEALPGIDFADYEAQQADNVLLKKSAAREHVEYSKEKMIDDNTSKFGIIAGKTHVTGRDMHSTKPGAGAELFGFQGVQEEEVDFSDRRGGRGGRGGRGDRQQQPRGGAGRAADRGQRQPARQGAGRKGGRIVQNEDEFPSL